MELGAGEPLFDRFVYDAEAAADLLEEAVRGMRARADWLRGRRLRKHTPTRKAPAQGRGHRRAGVAGAVASAQRGPAATVGGPEVQVPPSSLPADLQVAGQHR